MDDYGFLLEMNQIQEILLYFRDPPDWEAKKYFSFKLAKLIISILCFCYHVVTNQTASKMQSSAKSTAFSLIHCWQMSLLIAHLKLV